MSGKSSMTRALFATVTSFIFLTNNSQALLTCDHTCFGVPFGEWACSLANKVEIEPTPTTTTPTTTTSTTVEIGIEDRNYTPLLDWGDGGIPVDVCLCVLQLCTPFIYIWFTSDSARDPRTPVVQPPPAPPATPTPPLPTTPAPPANPATPLPRTTPTPEDPLEDLNPIRNFTIYMDIFRKTYTSREEMTFRETVFMENLKTVDDHNQRYLTGAATFFTTINVFGDLTFDEFAQSRTGAGKLRADRSDSPVPGILSRGELPVNPFPPAFLDYSQPASIQSRQDYYQGQGLCTPKVRDQGVCNSCAAQGTVTSIEYCLCLAGEGGLRPRSAQQISECTDGRGLAVGTMMQRENYFCETGFADVHMDFIMGELNGTLAPEADIPEREVAGDCNRNVGGGTRERMVDFMYGYFTTEDFLIDSLSLFGPTTTTMLVTPLMQLYGGGLFYDQKDCPDYFLEDVPEVCQVFKAGRLAYTCLKVGETNCAELLPDHCDIHYNTALYSHTVTAVAYGEDSETGNQFWKLQNSWGEGWGEAGYMKVARGLGHCALGTQYAVPQCRG